jgi:uncharacterized protein
VLVKMELFRIIISEISEGQQICLRELDGERVLKIMIGTFEATCIDRRVTQFPEMALGRPMTHELMSGMIDALGGKAEQVTITQLIEHTYYALIRIRKGEDVIEIDARPSDAIALATTYSPPLPIYVEESVLDES